MPRRENTFRVDYSQFPKHLSHDEMHKFVAKELGLTRENVLQLQPSRRLGCTFVKVNSLELAENIVKQHDCKHEFVFDGKSYKLRVTLEDGAVEVRVFDLPETITNEQVEAFLADYGDVIYVRDLLWDERYSEFGGIKTGVRIARVIVSKNIPSLVTIQGEETAVSYKGQRQTCLHCHEFAHIGIPCVQNKKLLVQKLVADQSYANVTKGANKLSSNTSPIPAGLRKPSSGLKAARTTKTSVVSEQPGTSGPAQNLHKASETRAATAEAANTMPPPAAPTATESSATKTVIQLSPLPISIGSMPTYRKVDGNDTDSSQASHVSNTSRRSRRQPLGKRMRQSGEAITTEHEHVPDEDMQQ